MSLKKCKYFRLTITFSADLSCSGIRYQMVHKGRLGPASCTYIFLWMQIWTLSLFCVHLNRKFKITPDWKDFEDFDAQTRLVKGAWSKVQKPEAFLFSRTNICLQRRPLKLRQTSPRCDSPIGPLVSGLAMMILTPGRICSRRDADRAKTKNSLFEKVNKR